MVRPLLDETHIHPAIRQRVAQYGQSLLQEVQTAIAAHPVVVIGMAWNPYPKRACRALDRAGLTYSYLSYGSYVSQWRRRNVLKMWTGWPTFPMVFVKGVLVGGATDLQRLIDSGELARMLA